MLTVEKNKNFTLHFLPTHLNQSVTRNNRYNEKKNIQYYSLFISQDEGTHVFYSRKREFKKIITSQPHIRRGVMRRFFFRVKKITKHFIYIEQLFFCALILENAPPINVIKDIWNKQLYIIHTKFLRQEILTLPSLT